MRYLSVCSGIEAATVAWHPLGWEPAAFSEIEAFPRAVLQHHYPDVPLHGDFTTIKGDEYGSIDLLVGGTPCQSFSVAGLRKGLDDPRGNLMLEYGALARRTGARWLVWENVPGVLSANGGRDFGTFLGMLAELGYGFAYRVLDAQYFGVAQRRRRVFVVGYLGDWRRAAAVLFERHSLSGDPAPSREAGEGITHPVAPCLTGSGPGVERAGDTRGQDAVVAARMVAFGEYVSDGTASAMKARDYKDATDLVAQTIGFSAKDYGADANQEIAPTLRAMGHNESHANGGGQLAVAQPVTQYGDKAGTLTARHDSSPCADRGVNVVAVHGTQDPDIRFDQAHTLRRNGGRENAIVFDTQQITSAANKTRAEPGLPASTIAKQSRMHVALPIPLDLRNAGRDPEKYDEINRQGVGVGEHGDPAHTLTKACVHGVAQTVAYTTKMHNTTSNNAGKIFEERTTCLDAKSPPPALLTAMAVRRLTPVECERLQGFPDNYTRIPSWSGWRAMDESESPEECLAEGLEVKQNKKTGNWRVKDVDGPRYKALGNSMAVPVMAWIGQRIQAVQLIPANDNDKSTSEVAA